MKTEGRISKKLEQARVYEKEALSSIPEKQRPGFHISVPTGWLNDPNGFSVYKGEYHLFYQYHPYGTNWGPMHWGHSKTTDFIKWEYLSAALAPDEAYDGQGCFSGSAVEHDGQHVLMYTAVLEKTDQDGAVHTRQSQGIAVGDGENYTKLDCNPVITADMLPEGSSPVDFRDPKIWKDQNTFYAIIGSRAADTSGQLVVFSSENLRDWKYVTILESCRNEYGSMWECPDFFLLDGKAVLLTSPQDMVADGLDFHGGNGTMYLIGDFDRDSYTFTRESVSAIDYGLDFYAPQTMETPDGRRIMIGWMESWDNHICPPGFRWSGMMSIPRELHVKEGKLYQNPVRELEQYYRNEVCFQQIKVQNPVELEGISGRQIDMTVEAAVSGHEELEIRLAAGEGFYTSVSYDSRKQILTMDRTFCGIRKDYISTRSFHAAPINGQLKLRILMDRYSVEVFVNDGEKAGTMLIYTPEEATGIRFSASEPVEMCVTKYDVLV